MTLIEALIALTLGSAIIGLAYGTWQQSLEARSRARAILGPVSQAATVRLLLSNWISAAHTAGLEEGVQFIGAGGETSIAALSFLTNDARPLFDSPATMQISLDRDSLTWERGLVATAVNARREERRLELLPEATSLRFEFLGTVEGVRQWYSNWHSAVVLPEAVRVTITTADTVRTVAGIPLIVPLSEVQ